MLLNHEDSFKLLQSRNRSIVENARQQNVGQSTNENVAKITVSLKRFVALKWQKIYHGRQDLRAYKRKSCSKTKCTSVSLVFQYWENGRTKIARQVEGICFFHRKVREINRDSFTNLVIIRTNSMRLVWVFKKYIQERVQTTFFTIKSQCDYWAQKHNLGNTGCLKVNELLTKSDARKNVHS